MANFNQVLFQWIYQFSGHSIILDDISVFIAQYLPYFLVLGFLILVFKESGMRRRIFLFCEGAMSIILARGILTEIIRFLYHHPRPFTVLNFVPLIPESSYSFPSGHAAWFFALSLTVFYANRKWGIWFFILSALNGIARIYVGVHWPLDILGGIVIGLFSAWLVHKLVLPYAEELNTRKSLHSELTS